MAPDAFDKSEPDAPRILGLDAFRQPPPDAGLSLDQLSAAFAEMLSAGDDPYDAASVPDEEGEGEAEQDELAGVGTADDLVADDATQISPKTILEAMLFVGSPKGESLTSEQVAGLMRGVRAAEIDGLVKELNDDYTARHSPYHIVSSGAGYRLILRPEFERVRAKFYGKARQARLSQAAVEVLAAVAYHGPITSEEITVLRGAASGHLLSQLVRRGLLRLDRVEKKTQYTVTPRFLQLFSLETLDELPRAQDLDVS